MVVHFKMEVLIVRMKRRTLVVVAVVFILALVVALVMSQRNKPEVDVNNGVDNGFISLPSLTLVSRTDSPMLYDFINGSIGWNWSYKVTELEGPFFAVLWQPNKPSTIFVSYYPSAEVMNVPPLGTLPKPYNINEQERVVILDTISKMEKRRVNDENEWQMLLVNEWLIDSNFYDYLDPNYKWAGINFVAFNDMSNNGIMFDVVQTEGNGYPTDWLRKQEWKEILESNGINIMDEFWDRWNYLQRKTYESLDGKQPEIVVVADEIGMFSIKDGAHSSHIKEEDLEMLLEFRGYQEKRGG
jgi:hypothetical protein